MAAKDVVKEFPQRVSSSLHLKKKYPKCFISAVKWFYEW